MPLYLGNKLVSGQTRPIDNEVTQGSKNLISSGAVKTYVDGIVDDLATEIPIQDAEPSEGNLWIDTSEDGVVITPEEIGAVTKEQLNEVISSIQVPVQSVNGKTGAVQLAASDVDAYAKDETLAAETKTLFGLGADAVPNDAFKIFTKHSWVRRTKELVLKETEIKSNSNLCYGDQTRDASYSSNIVMDENGLISLVNPIPFSIYGYTDRDSIISRTPAYFYFPSISAIYYIPENSQVFYDSSYNLKLGIAGETKARFVSSEFEYGEFEYLYSENENEYPHTGLHNGYEYAYIGTAINNILNRFPRLEFGTYVGSGTYGESNKTSLTFGLLPKIVIVESYALQPSSGHWIGGFLWCHGTKSIAAMADAKGSVSFETSGSTLSWFSSVGAEYQLNSIGHTYKYIAIG